MRKIIGFILLIPFMLSMVFVIIGMPIMFIHDAIKYGFEGMMLTLLIPLFMILTIVGFSLFKGVKE